MTEENCGNCRYWRHLDTREGHVADGTCRRRAPTAEDFPMAAETDWCGEWEGKPEELKDYEKPQADDCGAVLPSHPNVWCGMRPNHNGYHIAPGWEWCD